MRWRLVSERQLDKELLIDPKSSSLRLLLMRESNESGGWSWFWLDVTEAEIVVSFWNLGLVLKVKIEGKDGFFIEILGLMRVLGGFKLDIP